MPEFRTAHIGSYPRIGESKDQQRYRRGLGHFERKEISAHAFRDVEQSVIHEVMFEQISAGLDEISDGLISWQDPISHLCRNMNCFERTGLVRYFNNNFYYRQPRFISKPKLQSAGVAKEFQYAQGISPKPVRAVLTGPLTLAAHTDSNVPTFSKFINRVGFFTELLALEAKNLADAGAKTIQIDEPTLAAMPEEIELAASSLANIVKKAPSVKFVLALYYAPLTGLWDRLQDLPVSALNIDFSWDREPLLKKMLENPGHKEIGLGLIDARNTRLENAADVIADLRRWAEKTGATQFYLTPSSGLEMLPRLNALTKLQLISKVRQQYQGSGPVAHG